MEKKVAAAMESCREAVRTPTSYPLSAADRLVEPICLSDYGYLEKEYILKGKSNVYEWPAGQAAPTVRTSGVPYASRMLVRMPEDTRRFNGVVVVELLNYASKYDRSIPGWGHCFDYYLEHGMIWVGLTIRDTTMAVLKQFDPERYGELDFPNPLPPEQRQEADSSYGKADRDKENGLKWDLISQVSMLLRSKREDAPLKDYAVTQIMLTGATGGDASCYLAGIHPMYCREDGGPLYDGFLIYMTGAPGCINQTTPKMSELDERDKYYSEVPFIHVLTTGDMLGGGFHPDWAYMQRRPDADEQGRKLCRYELAGCGVRAAYDKQRCCCPEDVARTNAPWKDTVNYEYEYPVRYILRAATEALILWMQKGIAPPHSPLLEVENEYPNTRFLRDEAGNTKGGVRLPYVDAPLYLFQEEGGAVRLAPEVIRKLYSSKEDYLQKVFKSTLDALEGRWILKEDAIKILMEAANEPLPELA